MKAKHTPGPWLIDRLREKNEYGIEGIDISSPTYYKFASIWNMEGLKDENEANAKLIVAAPELLQGLIDAAHMDDDICKCTVCKIAKPLIKKATG